MVNLSLPICDSRIEDHTKTDLVKTNLIHKGDPRDRTIDKAIVATDSPSLSITGTEQKSVL